jgi:predicted metal-dependent enzyme (double-stranded beta helix superfamily)
VHIFHTADAVRRRAPIAHGPTAALLTGPGICDRVAVVHVELAPGVRLPEHDHCAFEIV